MPRSIKVCFLCLTFVEKGGEGCIWVEEKNPILLLCTYLQIMFFLSNFDRGYIKDDLTMEIQGCRYT
jgi:hypothetical protein